MDPIPVPELLPPITDPEKIVCIGLNYQSHAAEAGIDPPADPTFFAKFRNALASPGATVKLPAASGCRRRRPPI
jgi:acylpyruvate hydrolase